MKMVMPKIGMSMQDGTIANWLVQDGDAVKEGDEILEIQTEKLTTKVKATASGTFKKIAQVGDVVNCGEDICEIS